MDTTDPHLKVASSLRGESCAECDPPAASSVSDQLDDEVARLREINAQLCRDHNALLVDGARWQTRAEAAEDQLSSSIGAVWLLRHERNDLANKIATAAARLMARKEEQFRDAKRLLAQADAEIATLKAKSDAPIRQLIDEVDELLNILDAKEQLDRGFKGMGVNIVGEKAGRLPSQRRRVRKLLSALLTGDKP